MQPTFWEVARRPRWVIGFAVAILVAVLFSLLMQWQLSRTFNVVGVAVEDQAPVPLSELARPGVFEPFSFDRLASADVDVLGDSARVIANRLQLQDGETVSGYWVIANSLVEGASLTLALGFSEDLETARAVVQGLEDQQAPVVGYVQPTEAVKDRIEGELSSVSLGQLVNLYSAEPIESYPIYLILQSGIDTELEQISIEIRQQAVEINWLTAFYAVEWAFFALAAFYVWWRMVQDARLREAESQR